MKSGILKNQLSLLILILKELIHSSFWGEVTIIFKDGKLILIEKKEQIKLS